MSDELIPACIVARRRECVFPTAILDRQALAALAKAQQAQKTPEQREVDRIAFARAVAWGKRKAQREEARRREALPKLRRLLEARGAVMARAQRVGTARECQLRPTTRTPRGRRVHASRTSRGSPRKPSADDGDPPELPLEPTPAALYAHAAHFRGNGRVALWLERWGDEAAGVA